MAEMTALVITQGNIRIISFLRSGLRSSIPQLFLSVSLTGWLSSLWLASAHSRFLEGSWTFYLYFSSLALASCPFKKAFGENTEAKEMLASLSEMESRWMNGPLSKYFLPKRAAALLFPLPLVCFFFKAVSSPASFFFLCVDLLAAQMVRNLPAM